MTCHEKCKSFFKCISVFQVMSVFSLNLNICQECAGDWHTSLFVFHCAGVELYWDFIGFLCSESSWCIWLFMLLLLTQELHLPSLLSIEMPPFVLLRHCAASICENFQKCQLLQSKKSRAVMTMLGNYTHKKNPTRNKMRHFKKWDLQCFLFHK